MTDQLEQTRHKDTERNLILNRALTDLEQIINCHDPEIDVPIKDGVWNRLDKMAQEIEDRPAPAVSVEPLEAVRDALAGALGEAYDCTRVWEAWSYGTMGPDDFVEIACDDERLNEISVAILSALSPQPSPQDRIWNEALEAAAVVISDYQAFTKYNKDPLTAEMCADIRALKRGACYE